MRTAAPVIALFLAAVPGPAGAQTTQDLLDTLNRVLTPEQERDSVERRSRYDDYRRRDDDEYSRSDRREGESRDGESRYGERYNPSDDRFWSEEARRVDYEEMSSEERDRYDRLSERERERYDDEAGYERRTRYERMSDSERRRYDEELEDAYNEYRRRRG